jgi:hypothetical protein
LQKALPFSVWLKSPGNPSGASWRSPSGLAALWAQMALWTHRFTIRRSSLMLIQTIVVEKIQAGLAFPHTLATYLAQREAFKAFDVDQ